VKHELDRSLEILSRTPATLRALLSGVSPAWSHANEGPDTFSPFDVVGHLIHGEKTDWMVRAHWILEQGESAPFPAFDRFAQARESAGKTLEVLLDEFDALRRRNLDELRSMHLIESQFDLTGRHPSLGSVTLRQLVATWVVHDLDHLGQIARCLARQYRDEVGPWQTYLPILHRK
jgi:uncharacterized damage-inducible protein DinB